MEVVVLPHEQCEIRIQRALKHDESRSIFTRIALLEAKKCLEYVRNLSLRGVLREIGNIDRVSCFRRQNGRQPVVEQIPHERA